MISRSENGPGARPQDAHQREVKGHVALVATGAGITEILMHIARPLIGFGQQHPAGILRDSSEACFRQVL